MMLDQMIVTSRVCRPISLHTPTAVVWCHADTLSFVARQLALIMQLRVLWQCAAHHMAF